jgi:hypothetical protein
MEAIDRSGIMPIMGLATYRGAVIPEKRVITDKSTLSIEHDIHFGPNKDMTPMTKENGCPPLTDFLKILGPRAIDIANRGGRVAEATWYYFNYKWMGGYSDKYLLPEVNSVGRDPRKKSGDVIISWNQSLKPKSLVYRQGSMLSREDISGKQKYETTATSKMDNKDPMQLGTRWSKSELFLALKKYNSNVHFHLDGMGDIHDIVTKLGNYNYNVTSRELRFVFRYWREFAGRVHFYNGYDIGFNVVEVECPWKDDQSFTFTKVFTPF